MHPILFRIGSFELGTYGLILVLGFFAALGLAMRQGRKDDLAPEAISDLSVAVLVAGVVGAKLLMIAVDLANGATPAQVFSLGTLRAGGAVHGGIILGTAAFFWRVRKWKLPLAPTLDALAPAVALGEAIGRLGCLAAGCCYGTECHLPWAITFTSPDAQHFSGTPLFQALHPVQIYTLLAELAIVGGLLLLRPRRAFAGQVVAVFFILEGIGRSVLEIWRGDVDRGFWLGLPWLSTGRLTGLAFVLFGLGLWWWFRRPKTAATV